MHISPQYGSVSVTFIKYDRQMLYETPSEIEAKTDAVLKPYFAFCTTLPQQRN